MQFSSTLATAACLVLLQAGTVFAIDSDWILRKDKDGIRIYSQAVAGSQFNRVLGVTVLDTSLNRVVTLLREPEHRPTWDNLCSEVYVYKRISNTEELVYLHVNLPWPVQDRDMIMRTRWVQNAVTLKIDMASNAENALLPLVHERVRVEHATHLWELTPLESGKVRVTTTVHLDPEGTLPGWLLNSLSVDSPFKALENIRRVVADKNFIHRQYSFIREPS